MDFIDELKSQVDIVRVASEYVRLRRFGQRYSGLCPFHNEKTPSFSIYAEHQFYKCYGCDAKGDVINFVMMLDRLTFWEAVKKLADQHGIPLPKRSQAADDETRVRAALYEMHEIAAEHFQRNLAGQNGASVRAYLQQRGVEQASIQMFGLGLSDGSGRGLLRLLEQRGFRPEQWEQSGLAGRRDDGSFYDRFRNRLMFPIHSESGKIIAFGGRALDLEEKAKYLNSPETAIYKKSHVLYNLHRAKEAARQQDRLVMVEGYMDVIGASQAGIGEAVAPCGTSLTTEQIRMLKRHSQNLHLNFDPDAAGEKAAERSIKMLIEENVRVRIVELEGGLDPDEFCKQNGPDLYCERVSGAKAYFYWLADRARSKFNMREPQGRVDAFQFLLPAIQSLSDKLERVAVANDVASYLGVESGMILEHFRKMAADRAERSAAPKKEPSRTVDRILLPLLLTNAEARDQLIPQLRTLASMRQGPASAIYDVLISAHEHGESVSYNAVHTRLDEANQRQLAVIVLDAEGGSEPNLEDGVSCLEALRREERESVRRELIGRIKSAERAGNMGDAINLMHELAQLG